jgi:hypothetical protein
MNFTGASYRTPRRSLAAALLTPSPRMNRSGNSSLNIRAAFAVAIGSRLKATAIPGAHDQPLRVPQQMRGQRQALSTHALGEPERAIAEPFGGTREGSQCGPRKRIQKTEHPEG